MAKYEFRKFFFGGTTFCCCIPVRAGVILITSLGILLAGIISIICWYSVSTTPDLSTNERVSLVLLGLLETFLFAASVLGFAGAIARKQLFVQIYAYFIYFHFVANFAVAIYLLYVVLRFTNRAAYNACMGTIKDAAAQEQCVGLLSIGRGVWIGIVVGILIIELYGIFVVARYVNQVKREKAAGRALRLRELEEASFKAATKRASQQPPTSEDTQSLLNPNKSPRFPISPHSPGYDTYSTSYGDEPEFNPYRDPFSDTPKRVSYLSQPTTGVVHSRDYSHESHEGLGDLDRRQASRDTFERDVSDAQHSSLSSRSPPRAYSPSNGLR